MSEFDLGQPETVHDLIETRKETLKTHLTGLAELAAYESIKASIASRGGGKYLNIQELWNLFFNSDSRHIYGNLDSNSFQPANIDIRVGDTVHWVYTPKGQEIGQFFFEHPRGMALEDYLHQISSDIITQDLTGAPLKANELYVIPYDIQLDLPPELFATFSGRSSYGRAYIDMQVHSNNNTAADEIRMNGGVTSIYGQFKSLAWDMNMPVGCPTTQMRIRTKEDPRLTDDEIRMLIDAGYPLLTKDGTPLQPDEYDVNGGVAITLDGRTSREYIGLSTRTGVPKPIDLSKERRGDYDPSHLANPNIYLNKVINEEPGIIIEPDQQILACTNEVLSIPSFLCAELTVYQKGFHGVNNYAGYFNPGDTFKIVLELHSLEREIQRLRDNYIIGRVNFFYTDYAAVQYGDFGRNVHAGNDMVTPGRHFGLFNDYE